MRIISAWEQATGLNLKDIIGRRWDGRRREAVAGLVLALRASGWSYRRIADLLGKDPAGIYRLARSASAHSRGLAGEIGRVIEAQESLGRTLARLCWQNLDRALAFAGDEVALGKIELGKQKILAFLRLEVEDAG